MIREKNIKREKISKCSIRVNKTKLLKNQKKCGTKELITNEIINPESKKEGFIIIGIFILYLIVLFFINPTEIIKESIDYCIWLKRYFSESEVINSFAAFFWCLIIIIPIVLIVLYPFILPIIYMFWGDKAKLIKQPEEIKNSIWLFIKWCLISILSPLIYIVIVILFAILMVTFLNVENNIIVFFGFLIILICLFFKNYVLKCLFPMFIICFILINSINKEASVYTSLVFLSFISTLLINSIKYRIFNIVRIDLKTMHFIIKERINMLNEIIKIKNKSIIKEIAMLTLLVTSGIFFFTNNTMMISDNILMQKIIKEPICDDCEKGVYFIENKDISHNATINNVLKYAIFNNLISFDYKKNSILEGYKKDKYVIKEYNIPDYYVSFTPIIYTIGIITSIDNAQTQNYTHNNIITEYIILLYSIIGKILMGIIAYKIFLIRKE